jgi:hypothetical protein
MAEVSELEFVEQLLEDFDIAEDQPISVLLQALEDDEEVEED